MSKKSIEESLKNIIEERLLDEINKVKNSEEFINRSYLPNDDYDSAFASEEHREAYRNCFKNK